MMRDNDVFRWSYKDEYLSTHRLHYPYHAKSRIVITRAGLLRDTFWGSSSSDGATWTSDRAAIVLDLVYLGNLDDYEKHPEHHVVYYDPADVLNLNHSNSTTGNFYVRTGAKRSAARMREVIVERIEKAQREQETAARQIRRLNELYGEIANGKPLDEIYL